MTARNLIFAISAAILALSAGAPAKAAPVQWTTASGGNGHYYELVSDSASWTDARAAALASTHLGLSGYLATITSSDELAFLTAQLGLSNLQVWLGGSDAGTEGTWVWVDGPEAGQQFWSGGAAGTAGPDIAFANWSTNEPNDFLAQEDALLGWWSWDTWNDANQNQQFQYLVEFGDATDADVPAPATMLLLLSGLGALALTARNRRRG
jgi:hypothetical protein